MVSNIICGGRALKMAVGITALVLFMAGGASMATPISVCSTISEPGEYVLATDIMNSSASKCINIVSNDVTFDGAGYTIDGVLTFRTSGVYVYSPTTVLTNVTVKNLKVTGWGYGIFNNCTSNGIIKNNTAYGNDEDGIVLKHSSNNSLSGNNASRNGGSGIVLWDSSNNNILSDNKASNNYDGIKIESSSNNNITGNTANTNHRYGIGVSSSKNDLIGNNAANNEYGIYLSSSNNNLIGNNVSNNDYGFYLSSYGSNILSDNVANLNLFYGIYLSRSNSNILLKNIANSNSNGIRIESSKNNTLSDNIANSNHGGEGISLISSNNNSLRNNIVNLNEEGLPGMGGIGIYLQSSSSNILIDNTANSNSKYGILLKYSSGNNSIYNNFFNNTGNFDFFASNGNYWNTTKIPGTNIIGGSCLGGNFWAYPNGTGFSQTCVDSDKDGICDSLYTLDSNNIDYLPLAYNSVTPGPTLVDSYLPPGATPAVWKAGVIRAMDDYFAEPSLLTKSQLLSVMDAYFS